MVYLLSVFHAVINAESRSQRDGPTGFRRITAGEANFTFCWRAQNVQTQKNRTFRYQLARKQKSPSTPLKCKFARRLGQELQDSVQELQDSVQELQDSVQELQDSLQELQDSVQELQDSLQELQDS